MPLHPLSPRNIPLAGDFDVVVAGGGPAGCAAATAAAREGARTLLIEGTGILGGMGTAGLVPAWCPITDGEKIIHRGIAETVFMASRRAFPPPEAKKLDWARINPEQLKRIYDDLVTAAGVKLLFFTTACAVETDGKGRVTAVILASKAGLTAVRSMIYVDATGDGDIAAWAGAPFEKGDAAGELQPATHCFALSNVNVLPLNAGPGLNGSNPASPVRAMIASGRYPRVRDLHFCNAQTGPGTVGFNAGHLWDVDGTDPESLTTAMIEGRKIAGDIREGLREFHPLAFGAAHLAVTAPLMGIRETRRILGDHVLTVDDYRARRSFPDDIGRNCYYIDIHTSKAEAAGPAEKSLDGLEARAERYRSGESHGIPYRCLVPRNLSNVLVAGRCISADRAVQGSVRIMPVCLVTGEAAGVAAALAAKAGGDTRKVDTEDLRARLRKHGAWIP
ncbi:MAG: FAD-dependent oxidoreductase [Planctomycetota bacterium]